jgi:hypothetical protein
VNDHSETPWWRSRVGLATLSLLVVAAFYLLTEHTAHVFGALPYLLLLACPLMHFFHHGGHSHGPHGGSERPGGEERTDGEASRPAR